MTKAGARRFLLGAVDDSERQQIESFFIIDPETQEIILIAEDELVEDYIEGSLSGSEKSKFLEQYAHGPRQRRRLRIAESIREYAQTDALRNESGSGSPLQKLSSFLSLHWPTERKLYIPIGAAIATLLVVAALWLVQWNNRRTQVNDRLLAVEQELRDLNSPSSFRENPPQMFTLELPSVSLRSVTPSSVITPQAAYRLIQLQLLWPHKEEFQSYHAVLRRVGGIEKVAVGNLHIEKSPGGGVVRLRLPVHSLAPGLYQVTLTAIAVDGAPGPTEAYQFTIDS